VPESTAEINDRIYTSRPLIRLRGVKKDDLNFTSYCYRRHRGSCPVWQGYTNFPKLRNHIKFLSVTSLKRSKPHTEYPQILGPVYLATKLFSPLTYLFTPWSRLLLEKLTGFQLVKKFPAFYGTRRLITAFTSVRHLPLSWAS